jgi:L-amino acid N-acyltransferase YncA
VADIVIRDATSEDIDAMAVIYNAAVRTSVATFDLEERGAAYLSQRLRSSGPGDVVLAACVGGEVVGYALSASFRPRPAYRRTKETSIYLAEGARGRGAGRTLYRELLARLDATPEVHTQVAVIALPNDASEALHRSVGFERMGVLRELGHKFGEYVDTAWYQRLV